MATALNARVPEALAAESANIVPSELRVRQRGIAEITEMIHVSNYRFTHNIHYKIKIQYLFFQSIMLGTL